MSTQTPDAIEYGMQQADKMFASHKGCVERHLSRAQVAAIFARGFMDGQKAAEQQSGQSEPEQAFR